MMWKIFKRKSNVIVNDKLTVVYDDKENQLMIYNEVKDTLPHVIKFNDDMEIISLEKIKKYCLSKTFSLKGKDIVSLGIHPIDNEILYDKENTEPV